MKKLVLIDGHSILNRAFYGVPVFTNSKGVHTNAVYGFLNRSEERLNSSHIATSRMPSSACPRVLLVSAVMPHPALGRTPPHMGLLSSAVQVVQPDGP